MRKHKIKKLTPIFTLLIVFAIAMSGCNKSNNTNSNADDTPPPTSIPSGSAEDIPDDITVEPDNAPENEPAGEDATASELEVRFGRGGDPFTLHLYDNPTAAEIARLVGISDWDLPIYHYDDYENWEVMQFYDIPSRYEIPAELETATSQKAGEFYYSDPNRIVLFYHDAEVTGEYVKLGYIDYSEEFVAAVENNPVLEGWGNKIVSVSPAD